MGKFIKQLAETAGSAGAGGIIGAGMGLLMEGHQDRRQRRQQQALTDIQAKANREAANHSKDLQMQMWNETNYGAQMKHIKEAGLNPALIYGMSGAGGTTGSAMEAAVSGGQAPNKSEAMGMMRDTNIAMQAAQIDMLKSQAEKNRADATATAGVETNLKSQTIENLKQTVNNLKAQEDLTKIQGTIAEIQAKYADEKENYGVEVLLGQRDKLAQEWVQLANNNEITNATKEDMKEKIRTEAANAILQGTAIKAGIEQTKASTIKLEQDVLQGWQDLDIKEKRQIIEQKFMEKNIDLMTIDRVIKGIDGIGNVFKNLSGKGGVRN